MWKILDNPVAVGFSVSAEEATKCKRVIMSYSMT